MDEFDVVHVPAANRYELRHAGRMIGDLAYERREGLVVMIHSRVDEEFGGRGLAGRLVTTALTDARANGEHVEPQCPYVRAYIGSHPQWQDLLVTGQEIH